MSRRTLRATIQAAIVAVTVTAAAACGDGRDAAGRRAPRTAAEAQLPIPGPRTFEERRFLECLRTVNRHHGRKASHAEELLALASWRESRPPNFYGHDPESVPADVRERSRRAEEAMARRYGCTLW